MWLLTSDWFIPERSGSTCSLLCVSACQQSTLKKLDEIENRWVSVRSVRGAFIFCVRKILQTGQILNISSVTQTEFHIKRLQFKIPLWIKSDTLFWWRLRLFECAPCSSLVVDSTNTRSFMSSFIGGDKLKVKGSYQSIFDLSPLAEITPIFYKCCC